MIFVHVCFKNHVLVEGNPMVKEAIKKADVLIEALPYIKKFQNKIFVIKYGGSILSEERVRKSVLEDIAFLRYTGIKPILVHGGGPNITGRLKELKIPTNFIEGIRVTDEATLKVVEQELDELNDLIVKELSSLGVTAVSFKSTNKLLEASKKKTKHDLGFVGEVVDFGKDALLKALRTSIPVITPMGVSKAGTLYNINADEVAFFLASKLAAEKLVLLTNILGVMRNQQDENSLIPSINIKEADNLIKEKIIEEGMIPKVKAAVKAIEEGVGKAHIIDAKIPHAILLEIFTQSGIGTEIVK
ncbi:MAG: acetylglutamate kinase [Candidatus Omnitrophica bacterium]|nr:acetylglutamate kinase [Candidatus Omnitrophota bacterium]